MATSFPLLGPCAASLLLSLTLTAARAAAQQPAPPPPGTAASADGSVEAGGANDDAELPGPSPRPSAPKPTADPAGVATPEASAESDATWTRPPPARRGGLTVGLAGGLALGTAAGYPNDVLKIGFARHYTETGVAIGTGGMFWIGGALTDWLNFGVGACADLLNASDLSATAGGFVFHTEAFPLFPLGDLWRDLGVAFDAGTGVAFTTSEADNRRVIDGALPARIGVGAFYEGFRLWKLSAGPWLYADYTWSSSVRQGSFYLGLRTALYTKP